MTSVYDCAVVQLRSVVTREGTLVPVEAGGDCPFSIPRVYYLYDVPAGASRGGHAHRKLEQFLVAVSGSFDVLLDDGARRRTVTLNRPTFALHLVPGIWRELHNFSAGAICLVLASERYDRDDYFYRYDEFRTWKKQTPADL